MKLGMVRSPLTWAHWTEARALLVRSVDKTDDVTIEEVEAGLESGEAQLWVALDGDVKMAGVTQLLNVKDGKQCFIWQLGGQWGDYALDLFGEVEAWAWSEGCSSIEGNMRPGFERLLKDWRKTAVTLRKAL